MDLSSKKVVICDDDEALLESLTFFVEAWGVQVVPCSDGAEGAKKILSEKPDLIISDINMPNMTGLELLETLNKVQLQVPLIFLTGNNDLDSYRKSLVLGSFEFLTKPVDVEKLKSAVDKALLFGKMDYPKGGFKDKLKKAVG